METLVNEYWMYENEPMHLIRFTHNNTRYLIGKEIQESTGVEQSRKRKFYNKPTAEVMQQVFGVEE